eukprot:7385703-Prymnesium_polylepis.1
MALPLYCPTDITEECLTCSSVSRGSCRRVRGTDLPWGINCYGANVVAQGLIAGYYVLLAPCIHPFWSVAITAVHIAGISVYVWLLRCEAADPNCLNRTQADQATPGMKWCRHCACYVNGESRTKHCHACKKCIDGFDHHCDFLQTCVGRRNYRAFIALVSMLCVWTAALIALDALTLALGASMDSCRSIEKPWRVALLG